MKVIIKSFLQVHLTTHNQHQLNSKTSSTDTLYCSNKFPIVRVYSIYLTLCRVSNNQYTSCTPYSESHLIKIVDIIFVNTLFCYHNPKLLKINFNNLCFMCCLLHCS